MSNWEKRYHPADSGSSLTAPSSLMRSSTFIASDSSSPQQLRRQATSTFRDRLTLLRRPSSKPAVEDLRGPLGLTLVFEPSEPEVDFVFVHGLNGGSRKTWSASDDVSSFWPGELLPSERGFRKVRIHSFGYDSDWTQTRKSTLTIHDFGQALLADMANSSHLRRNSNTSIVLIAHSMGGLVAKKAYLLAKMDPMYNHIASRIHSIYFLGTPHRGADAAETLHAFQPGKHYVAELVPGAGTLQAVNDAFRHHHDDVSLWSFWEACPTSAAPLGSRFIVSKDSAILGLPGEHQRYLQADHRHLCKFSSVDDPNYRSLTDCFRTTLEEIGREDAQGTATRHKGYKDEMRRISQALETETRPLSEVAAMLDKKHQGSCEWLTTQSAFQAWSTSGFEVQYRSDDTTSVRSVGATRFLWIRGPPGSGKSVASAHIVQHLESLNMDCCYFFFKGGAKTTAKQLLTSFVIQMAQGNFTIRQALLLMLDDGELGGSQDHTSIWNSIFLGHIFKTRFIQPQFWVLDGLDECPNRALATLLNMFAKIDPSVPLRISVSSRVNDTVERLIRQENIQTLDIQTGGDESLQDIENYLTTRLSHRLATQRTDLLGPRNALVRELVAKSDGIFLWVSLVVPMLEATYTIESMMDVLHRVPSEMTDLYQNILETIRASPNAAIAYCILKWVVCAPTLLNTNALEQAVQHDLGQTLWATDMLSQICGNLIIVDDGYVRLMHQTVKEFLTSGVSGPYVNRSSSHAEIGELCLQQLNSRKFQPPPYRRIISASGLTPLSPLEGHIVSDFSHHLARASMTPPSEHLLHSLADFMATNLVTWVERMVTGRKLAPLMVAIENLRTYLFKYGKDQAPLEPEYHMVDSMVGDLTRVLSVFGPYLVDTPASIYNLIPPLCPTKSMFHQKFGKQARQRVLSSSNQEWDERLSCFISPRRVLSIACSDRLLALGLLDGNIRLHNPDTFEPVMTLSHGQPVRILAFGAVSSVLLSCSAKELVLWGKRQEQLWRLSITGLPLSLGFNLDDSTIIVPCREGFIRTISADDGVELDPQPLPGDSSDSDSDSSTARQKGSTPLLMRHCSMLNLTAIAYRSSPLIIAQFDTNEKLGEFEKAGYEGLGRGSQVLDVNFSSASDLRLMAVSYQDGDIVTIDPWTQRQVGEFQLHTQTLASSPDGYTLAAGDNAGVVWLFSFETLRPLCRITSLEERIDGIVFASSNLRVFDIRGTACNVWEPPALVQRNTADDSSSDADDVWVPIKEASYTRTFDAERGITSMAHTHNGKHVFCGREDGCITIHEVQSGTECISLRLHAKNVEIRTLQWCEKASLLISSDVSGRYIATQLRGPVEGWTITGTPVDQKASGVISHIVTDPTNSKLLVATDNGEEHMNISPGPETTHSQSSTGTGRWMQHPGDPNKLLLLNGPRFHIFEWQGLKRLTSIAGIEISSPVPFNNLHIANEWYQGKDTSLIQWIPDLKSSGGVLISLDVSRVPPSTSAVEASCASLVLPSSSIKTILGVRRSSLYFVDGKGWICSIVIKKFASGLEAYTKHFFIPPFWQVTGQSLLQIVSKNDAVLAYRDDVVVFQNFLEFEKKVPFTKQLLERGL